MSTIMKRDNGNQPATFGTVLDQIFQNNLNRFFDDEYSGFSGLAKSRDIARAPVNIRETDKSYEMELFAPGFKKQDFHLNLEGDKFTVSAESEEETKMDSKNEGWSRQEYKKQGFARTFNLDDTVDTGKITARYDAGVLHLILPKKENAQKITREISVQ